MSTPTRHIGQTGVSVLYNTAFGKYWRRMAQAFDDSKRLLLSSAHSSPRIHIGLRKFLVVKITSHPYHDNTVSPHWMMQWLSENHQFCWAADHLIPLLLAVVWPWAPHYYYCSCDTTASNTGRSSFLSSRHHWSLHWDENSRSRNII